MPEIHLFIDDQCQSLYPFHLVEGLEGIRHGAFTQRERWDQVKQQLEAKGWSTPLHINGRWIPNEQTAEALIRLPKHGELHFGKERLAFQSGSEGSGATVPIQMTGAPRMLNHANDLFTELEDQIVLDMDALKSQWRLQAFSAHPPTHVFGPTDRILVSGDAVVRAATLDTTNGPIVIGPNARVEQGSHIEGPVVLNESAVVRTGAHIRGATVIGPHCKVGGEISNVNFQGWANKAHSGFLGNSVIGRWCNLGAGTESSNLKNTYGSVKQWSESKKTMVDSSLQFCGVLMGDHCKCGIGTTLNTGTVMGPASVVFDAGFPPKHLPPFSWHNAKQGTTEPNDLHKMLSTAEVVMSRRDMSVSKQARVNLSDLHAKRHN